METMKLVMLAGALALAGCSPPLAQGGKTEVQSAASDTIRVAWNPKLTDEQAARSIARAYCGGRDFDEMGPAAGEPGGTVMTKTWRCHHFPGSGAGM